MFESKRRDGKKGVTLLYRLYTSEMDDMEETREFVSKLGEAKFKPDFSLDMVVKGHVDNFKKNRVKLKLDHAKMHVTSQEFKFGDVLQLLKVMDFFGDGTEAVTSNPVFKVL